VDKAAFHIKRFGLENPAAQRPKAANPEMSVKYNTRDFENTTMGQRKTSKNNLIKCRGFNVAPCFHCKRLDATAPETLIPKMNTGRNGINYCEHFYWK
jgi:hypothetical protein